MQSTGVGKLFLAKAKSLTSCAEILRKTRNKHFAWLSLTLSTGAGCCLCHGHHSIGLPNEYYASTDNK